MFNVSGILSQWLKTVRDSFLFTILYHVCLMPFIIFSFSVFSVQGQQEDSFIADMLALQFPFLFSDFLWIK